MDKKTRSPWTEDELRKVARWYYLDGETQQNIADLLRRSRQDVNRMLKEAELRKIVQIRIVDYMNYADLRALERKLRHTFPALDDAVIVQGHSGIEPVEPSAVVEDAIGVASVTPIEDAVSLNIAEAAGLYLSSILRDKDIVLIGRGRMMKATVANAKFTVLPKELKIVPMSGFMKPHYDLLDANVIAADFERVTQGKYFWLPIPAVIPSEHEEAVKSLPIVKNTLELMQEAKVIVTGIGSTARFLVDVDKDVVPETERTEFLQQCEAEGRTPVGEICNLLYGRDGKDIPYPKLHTPGFSLENMRKLVRGEGKVIGVVGADPHRYDAILGALEGGLINVLITDHVTAQAVLSKKAKWEAEKEENRKVEQQAR